MIEIYCWCEDGDWDEKEVTDWDGEEARCEKVVALIVKAKQHAIDTGHTVICDRTYRREFKAPADLAKQKRIESIDEEIAGFQSQIADLKDKKKVLDS